MFCNIFVIFIIFEPVVLTLTSLKSGSVVRNDVCHIVVGGDFGTNFPSLAAL